MERAAISYQLKLLHRTASARYFTRYTVRHMRRATSFACMLICAHSKLIYPILSSCLLLVRRIRETVFVPRTQNCATLESEHSNRATL